MKRTLNDDMKDADKRIVEYERIHSIRPIQFLKLNQAIAPKNGERILDAAAGYGSVSKSLHAYARSKHLEVDQYLLEESRVQMKRARRFLPWMKKERMVVGSMLRTPYPDGFFDTIVVKMGLHEVARKQQLRLFREMRRIIRAGGKLIIWDLAFNRSNQKILSDIIRKKDLLAGYKQLAKMRYFPTSDEILTMYHDAGFAKVKAPHSFTYRFASRLRLEEEFGGDRSKLLALNAYIEKLLPTPLKKRLKFVKAGDSVSLNFSKKIFIGV
ncbi:class I SAM-dependent methyltransferase [Patescibacteria group bacterium]|nr:MAG: class I SAM-dependent methyltransferase [Patescibacteria group bacterium]